MIDSTGHLTFFCLQIQRLVAFLKLLFSNVDNHCKKIFFLTNTVVWHIKGRTRKRCDKNHKGLICRGLLIFPQFAIVLVADFTGKFRFLNISFKDSHVYYLKKKKSSTFTYQSLYCFAGGWGHSRNWPYARIMLYS